MQFKCDTCKEMRESDEVVRTKPYSAERRVKCYDCSDNQDRADAESRLKRYLRCLKSIRK